MKLKKKFFITKQKVILRNKAATLIKTVNLKKIVSF